MGLNGIQYFVENTIFQQDKSNHKISKTEFESFCKGYIFDKLKGYRFGKEFCNKFKINDLLILHESSTNDRIIKYILKNYVT